MSTNFPAYPFCECTQWRLASESWKVQGTSNPPCKTGRLHEQRIYGRLGNHSWNLIGTCHLWPSEHGLLMASSTHQIILSHAIPCHPPTSPYCWLHFFRQSICYPPINIQKDVENPPWVYHFPHIFFYMFTLGWVCRSHPWPCVKARRERRLPLQHEDQFIQWEVVSWSVTTWHGGTTPVSLYILYGQRKFRSHTSDLWTDAATVVRAVREENESEEKESVERRARCQGPQKSRKIARDCVVPCFFRMFCGSRGRCVGLRKRRVQRLPGHLVICGYSLVTNFCPGRFWLVFCPFFKRCVHFKITITISRTNWPLHVFIFQSCWICPGISALFPGMSTLFPGISAQKNRHIFTQSRIRSAQKVRNKKLTAVVKKWPCPVPSQEIRPKGRNSANGHLYGSFQRSMIYERSKSARRCGAKHVRKSKVLKLTVSGHFWKSRCQKGHTTTTTTTLH